MTRITFHGGAGTVTGSKHLVETGRSSVLVDCGLFQGRKELRLLNWEAPQFDPAALDAVILTHAHIDHSGWLPRLSSLGFKGPIYATPATADLADVMLHDAAKIQEEDARYANERGFSKHHPALPLYTVEDAERALALFEVVDYEAWQTVRPDVRFRYVPAGHIIGSGLVEMDVGAKDEEPLRLLFSGDVGRYDAPLVTDPTPPRACDAFVVESTYGDRTHPTRPVTEQLADVLRSVQSSGGIALVPAFAVGRSQQILYLLRQVMEDDPSLAMAVHLDSPMAVDATHIYRKYPEECCLEEIELQSGNSVLFDRGVYVHRTRDESLRLNDLQGPRVILSSSGMLTGGRVLHHLRRLAPDSKNLIVLAGYQAPGTRGWRIEQGEPTVRVHGRDVKIAAQIARISGLSAHADVDELMRWIEPLAPPARTFVVHGEPAAAQALAERLRRERGFTCDVPQLGEGYDVNRRRRR